MRRERWVQLLAGVVLVACLLGAGAMMPGINASASHAQLKYTDEATEGAPAPIVVAQSVGVLRGIIANYLWIRADKLKEDGKFFEAYQLSRWITQLQPRFASVWQFQSWNMAYNISVATHTRAERWQWVRDGIQLLRNHGLRYNPNDMMLHREIAWTFIHKIGGFTDDAHKYYKQQLADEWQGLLGEPPYDHEEKKEFLQVLIDAPDRWEQVVETFPAAADLRRELEAAGYGLNIGLLRDLETLRALEASPVAARVGLASRIAALTEEDLAAMPPEAQAQYRGLLALRPLLVKPEYQSAWPALVAHTRKRILLDEYNMDPIYMLQFTEQYGPLDWRGPNAHAVYWAALGVEKGLSRLDQSQFDRINTDRIIFHSEQALKRMGRIYHDFITKETTWGPDLRFIPFYEETFKVVLTRVLELDDIKNAQANYRDGYRNFLIDAVREYYMWGEYEKAHEYYAKLRAPEFAEEYRPDRFTYPLDEFILRESASRYNSLHVATNDVLGLLYTAYTQGLARGDRKTFDSNWRLARMIFDYFNTEVGNNKTVVTEGEGRLAFVWEQMVPQAFQMAMTNDESTMGERLALWAAADNDLKLISYDLIAGELQSRLAQSGLPIAFEEAFPPPAGLEQYRLRKAAEGAEGDERRLNVERK